MKARLICLIRRHQWHNGSNDYEHQTVWTCKRCGKSKRRLERLRGCALPTGHSPVGR
jgi:hypothetical protein